MGGRNTEGYPDPTANTAVGRVAKEEKKKHAMLKWITEIVSIIQKISVVRNDDNRIFEVHQKVFEPLRGLYVEVVRGFV